MKFTPLLENEVAKQGYTHRLDFSYRDIPAGIAVNTAKVFTVAAIPAGTIIRRAFFILVTAFENTADAAFNNTALSLGDGGSATRYINAIQVNINGTEILNSDTPAANFLYTAADSLLLTIGSMAAKSISDLNKGQGIILLEVQNENRAAIIDGAAA